jgi:hypothetical protein
MRTGAKWFDAQRLSQLESFSLKVAQAVLDLTVADKPPAAPRFVNRLQESGNVFFSCQCQFLPLHVGQPAEQLNRGHLVPQKKLEPAAGRLKLIDVFLAEIHWLAAKQEMVQKSNGKLAGGRTLLGLEIGIGGFVGDETTERPIAQDLRFPDSKEHGLLLRPAGQLDSEQRFALSLRRAGFVNRPVERICPGV